MGWVRLVKDTLKKYVGAAFMASGIYIAFFAPHITVEFEVNINGKKHLVPIISYEVQYCLLSYLLFSIPLCYGADAQEKDFNTPAFLI